MSLSSSVPEGPLGQALPPGTRLEEFVIERVLGSGGFGITYLAVDIRLGRQVVIKENLPAQFAFRDTASLTVRPRHTQGEDAENFAWSQENFAKEAGMLASLDHPGIVRVLRSFEALGTAYFVMPFVEGTALDEQIRERRGSGIFFTEAEIRKLLERTLDALDYLHARGIYHRDIKPGNLLITREGVPVLIDFGSARQRLGERSLTVIESPGYTPFEQLQSRGKIGPWSDLYALGGTLYKAITGETPPKATDRALEDEVVPLAKRDELLLRYSSGLLASIDRAMAPRIEGRFQEAAEWRRFVWEEGGEPGVIEPDGAPKDLEENGSAPMDSPRTIASTAAFEAVSGGKTLESAAGGLNPEASQAPRSFTGMSASRSDESVKRPHRGSERFRDARRLIVGGVAAVLAVTATIYFATKPNRPPQDWNAAEAPQEEIERFAGLGIPDALAERGRRVMAAAFDPAIPDPGPEVQAKGFRDLKEAADLGHVRAMFHVGLCLNEGHGVARDEVAAVRWYRKAAELGDSSAMFSLGICLTNGIGGGQDDAEAVRWYRKAAEAGNTHAMLNLGLCLSAGIGVEKDEMESVKWFRKAAEAGNAPAMHELGACLQVGIGVAKDEVEAVSWYRKAADEGDPDAMHSLGFCLSDGIGVVKDEVEAVKWFRKAADEGVPIAMFNLGVCLMNGSGAAKDEGGAVVWYRKAAEEGVPNAMLNLGVCLSNGVGVLKNEVESVKWFRKAAELGNSDAMFHLGSCFSNGIGVSKSEEEAVIWFRKSAELDNPDAMLNLGLCLSEGVGVVKDPGAAVVWYRKAAEAGNSSAMLELGLCLLNDDGVPKDEAEAVNWFRKAAEAGNDVAMNNIGVCYKHGLGVEKNERDAWAWFRKAAEMGSGKGMYNLGYSYWNGSGVEKDEQQGCAWLEKAAKAGVELDVSDRVHAIMFKDVEFVETPFNEAIDFIESQSVELDPTMGSSGRGVAITFHGFETKQLEQVLITLRVQNIPLKILLDYVTELAGVWYQIESDGVVILGGPKNGADAGNTPPILEQGSLMLGGGSGGGNPDGHNLGETLQDLRAASGSGDTEGRWLGISFPEGPDFFPKSWLEQPISARLEPLAPELQSNAAKILEVALSKYPGNVLERYLSTVALVGSLQFYDNRTGGTYLGNSQRVVLVYRDSFDPRGFEQRFHHEFSSILLKFNESKFDHDRWAAANKPGFHYRAGGVIEEQVDGRMIASNVLAEEQKKTGGSGSSLLALDPKLMNAGFLTAYNQISMEQDINETAAHLFANPDIWSICQAYPRIDQKVKILIEFYHTIDKRFDTLYFRELYASETKSN